MYNQLNQALASLLILVMFRMIFEKLITFLVQGVSWMDINKSRVCFEKVG